MPTRSRFPSFLIVLVCVFAFVGLASFQILKERKIATANLDEKQLQLDNAFVDLRKQAKLVRQREKERDFAQSKLLELEHESQFVNGSLRGKDLEIQELGAQYDRALEELAQAKKSVKQKDDEIYHIRSRLQIYSFEKAKESAEQITSRDSTQETKQAEQHKPADEAGIDDRKRLQEEEDSAKDGDVSATEKEMHERSQPKEDVLNEGETNFKEMEDQEAADNLQESSKKGGLQEQLSEEQDAANLRDLDEKDNDSNREQDVHGMT